jgi:hypothetical protein
LDKDVWVYKRCFGRAGKPRGEEEAAAKVEKSGNKAKRGV